MKLSIARNLAALASLATLAGCAVAPGSQDDPTGDQSSAMAGSGTGGSGGTINWDPTVQCSPIVADDTMPLSAPYTIRYAGGTANLSRACSDYVLEVDGIAGTSFGLYLSDTAPSSLNESPSFLDGRKWASSQSDCLASYFTYDVMGYVPAHVVVTSVNPPMIKTIPEAWSTVNAHTSTPQWTSSTGTCQFALSTQAFAGSAGPYTKLRIAAAEVVSTPSGYVSHNVIFGVGH